MSSLFNGDSIPQRKNTNSVKWDTIENKFGQSSLLPLWVADMDFPSPQCVKDALKAAVDFGIYAYFNPPASYQDAFINWEKNQHGLDLEKEWLRFTPGVVSGICWCIQTFTDIHDGCIILTPCYYPFMNSILDNNRKLVTSDLISNGGVYTIDFDDFEKKIEQENVKMFLLCSPHNPVGRVWKKEEIHELVRICLKHNVYIVSDEIHQDIVFGHIHYSTLNATESYDKLIVLTSGSKTFNLAGCQNSFAIIPSYDLQEIFDNYIKKIHIKKGVLFGYIAAESAFRNGKPWLDEVIPYIFENYKFLKDYLTESFPQISFSPLEGTYMCWLDLGYYVSSSDIVKVVQDYGQLAVDYGNWFWPNNCESDSHIRINLATSRFNVEKAAKNLIAALKKHLNA